VQSKKQPVVGGGNMSSNSQWIKAAVLMMGILLLTACATINKHHPQVVTGELTAEQKAQVATVYFIRPKPYKAKGVSDYPVYIEFQKQLLLKQAEGNYSLLYIKPSKGLLVVRSKTLFTNRPIPVDVWRSREYKFIEGKTYFIYIRQINEEFRGVFYEPEPVSLREAKELIVAGDSRSSSTLATGAARSAPIDKLTEVDVPPASAIKGLDPALPENIYKQEKYLHKVQ
jgi:hypothetical protein